MQNLKPVVSFWSATYLPQWNNFLRVIMIVANKKSTATPSYIMSTPLSIKDTSIEIQSLLFAFLKAKYEVSRKNSNTFS